jgi:hypothetical protein
VDTASKKTEKALQALLRSLMREFFQTETSALSHCRREAKRLGTASPTVPLNDIASHAEGVLKELPALAKKYDLPVSAGGIVVGRLFSEARDKVFDRLIRMERSYRGTMLGVRHGIDLVVLFQKASHEAGYEELAQFCAGWLATRQPLVASLEQELTWFAREPVGAMHFVR